MDIRIASDLHLEFETYRLPKMKGEKNMTLILAGDVCNIRVLPMFHYFWDDVAARFGKVLYVFGNHEFYKAQMDWAVHEFQRVVAGQHRNIEFTSYGKVIEHDGITFVMATLWTAWNHPQSMLHSTNEFSMINAGKCMGDFFCIRDRAQIMLTPEQTKVYNAEQWDFIKKSLEMKQTEKSVVITHHSPSVKSTHPKYHLDSINPAFSSDFSSDIAVLKPDLMIHGHTHDSFDYLDNEKTRIVANPKGYGSENYAGFNPRLVISI